MFNFVVCRVYCVVKCIYLSRFCIWSGMISGSYVYCVGQDGLFSTVVVIRFRFFVMVFTLFR